MSLPGLPLKERYRDMNQLNSILIEGNLTRDPQLKETPRGTQLCTFGLASNRYMRKGEEYEKETSFFDIETWSGLAQTCGDKLRKGRGVRVVGRLKQDRWTGTDGKPRSAIKIVAEHVEFKPELKEKVDEPEAQDVTAGLPGTVHAGREAVVF